METFHQFLDKARQEKKSAIRWVKAWQKEYDLRPARGNPGFRAAAFLVRRHQQHQQQQQQYYYYDVEEDPTVVVYCDDEEDEEEYYYNCCEEEDDSISSCSSAVVVVRTPTGCGEDDDGLTALHQHSDMERKQPCYPQDSSLVAVEEAGRIVETAGRTAPFSPAPSPSTLAPQQYNNDTQMKKRIVASLLLQQVVIRKRDQWKHQCVMYKIVSELRNRTRQRSRHLQDYAFVIQALQQKEHCSELRSLSSFQETPSRTPLFAIMTTGMKELQTFYLLFDQVIHELQDFHETLELQGFQQLVIHELMERHVARAIHQERFQLIVGQLNQRFIMQEMFVMNRTTAAAAAGRHEQQREQLSSLPLPNDSDAVISNNHHHGRVHTTTPTPQRTRRREPSEWVQVLERSKPCRHPQQRQTRDPCSSSRNTPYEEEDDWVLCEESE